jgi:hypothetical protein
VWLTRQVDEALGSAEKLEHVDSPEKLKHVDSPEKLKHVDSPEEFESFDRRANTIGIMLFVNSTRQQHVRFSRL